MRPRIMPALACLKLSAPVSAASSQPRSGSQLPRFFFFQAEDGIRGADVTGVQTCALPICWPAGPTKRWPRETWLPALRGSEERRAGKERKSRGPAEQDDKKQPGGHTV